MIETEPARQTVRESKLQSVSSLLFIGIVSVYCVWIFSIPIFPTQDGPVHLYYTTVLAKLFSGSQLFSSTLRRAIRFRPTLFITFCCFY